MILLGLSLFFVAFFIYIWSLYRTTGLIIPILAWSLNLTYELWNEYQCIGECDIRNDMFLIYPIMFIFTLMGLSSWLKGKKSSQQIKITTDSSSDPS